MDGLVGYQLTPMIAVEGEGLEVRQSFRKIDVGQDLYARTYGGIANLKVQIPFLPKVGRFGIVPYAAGGVGYGDILHSIQVFPYTARTLSHADMIAQARGGVEITTGTPLSFDIAYRYLHEPEHVVDGEIGGLSTSDDLRTHTQAVTVGIRYNI